MRFSVVNRYRYFLFLCLLGILGFGGAYYYESNQLNALSVSAPERKEVYASGKIVGVYEQTSGVLVVDTAVIKDVEGNECCPSKGKLKSGDYINSINAIKVSKKEDLVNIVSNCGGNKLEVGFVRKNKEKISVIEPIKISDDQYAIGLWVKDDMAGIGTMTFVDANGNFGALGHGIGNGNSGELLSVKDGCIYDMDLNGVTKGEKGLPGELSGIIYYGRKTKYGDVTNNSDIGIYGKIDKEKMQELSQENKYEIGYINDIKKGKAYILSEISGQLRNYEIEIIDVDKFVRDDNKGIYFEVTDSDLKNLTGGIVQGMSGSPIIQDGRIIGAVTHVLVNDPTKGYGIFIETMLNEW